MWQGHEENKLSEKWLWHTCLKQGCHKPSICEKHNTMTCNKAKRGTPEWLFGKWKGHWGKLKNNFNTHIQLSMTFIILDLRGRNWLACVRPTAVLRKARKAGQNKKIHIYKHLLKCNSKLLRDPEQRKLGPWGKKWIEPNQMHCTSFPFRHLPFKWHEEERLGGRVTKKMAKVLKHKAEFLQNYSSGK